MLHTSHRLLLLHVCMAQTVLKEVDKVSRTGHKGAKQESGVKLSQENAASGREQVGLKTRSQFGLPHHKD